MTLSEAIKAATQIVKCYPNGGRDAGEGYIGALAATLGQYPRQVALRCADPMAGIIRRCKFMPTAADLYAWLEEHTEPLRRQVDRDKRIEQQFEDRVRFEDLERNVRPSRMTLSELKERYGDWHDDWRPLGLSAKEKREAARAMLIAEIGENGADILDALPDAAE